MKDDTVVIARRFRGPPRSGNGGYCAGLLARGLEGAVEVTLHAPPPLEQPLALEHQADTRVLRDGERVIARAQAAALELAPPAAVSFEQAARCSQRFVGFDAHVFPECFVCGPARASGDGLRIFAGPADDGHCVAAPWVPLDSDSEHGVVRTAVAWAALDCPGYFAAASGVQALLGRMSVELLRLPVAGERHVILAWPLGREGRKIYAGTALYDEAGVLIGRARQTWIATQPSDRGPA